MPKKPTAEEFELSDVGMRHKPTDDCFVPYPGNPGSGHWRNGHAKGGDYDEQEVRELGRKL
jgi:hypothetical protein